MFWALLEVQVVGQLWSGMPVSLHYMGVYPHRSPCKGTADQALPGKPVADNYGLLWLIYELLWDIVAFYFRLLGVPGKSGLV